MMMLRVALAQRNLTVGDLDGNTRCIVEGIERARALGSDVVAFPELSLCGYPPEDLLLKPQFRRDQRAALRRVALAARGCVALVGYVDEDASGIYNAMAVLWRGRVAATYRKICLPNYGVFDERRYFVPGRVPLVIEVGGVRLGVSICEDLWMDDGPPLVEAHAGGAQVLLNISASPYHAGKRGERRRLFARRAREAKAFVAYLNLVGGQDELVFDGASMVLDPRGRLLAEGRWFEEDLIVVDLPVEPPRRVRVSDRRRSTASRAVSQRAAVQRVRLDGAISLESKPLLPERTVPRLELAEEVYAALVMGTRDYVRKNGFTTVAIGLSGGIDSALTAAIAVDAIGAAHVMGVVMPSRYSSRETQQDAEEVARRLGVQFLRVPIDAMLDAYLAALAPTFQGAPANVTEENLQARIRGNLLMALSNKFGWLVLTTGNKSEVATGYCTLYGDMAGGFAVLKDVPKGLVYQLAQYRNRRDGAPVIPESVIQRPPTAELRPNQTDQDTLPPYDLLDAILQRYVEEDASYGRLLRNGFPSDVVRQVVRMVDTSEYKRRQGPPGIKITPKAFGKDRRMPITNRYRAWG